MTSRSPTKRRTTPPATRRDAREPARAVVEVVLTALVAAWSCAGATAGWRDLQRSEPPPPVVTVPLASDDVIGSPPTVGAADGERDEAPIVVTAAEDPPAIVVAAEAAAVDSSADEDESDAAGGEGADECRQALQDLRADSLDGINLDIRVTGTPGSDFPYECRLEGETFEPRRFATTTFTWKAAGYCHKPLYFEHWNLERYGHSHGFVADSFLSAAHFFARIPALPYQMGVELPWECVYPLGYYRPGSCAPWTVPAVPVSVRGLAVGAATATGIVFLLP